MWLDKGAYRLKVTSAAPDLTAKRSIYSRNDVAWISAKSWRAESKRADLAAFKGAKAVIDQAVLATAAGEVSALVRRMFGPLAGWTVSTVAVGHSRRPDSFAVRLAQSVAADLGLRFDKVFADRFVTGSSHPKEFSRLPPLQLLRSHLVCPILLVDDVATSGWHMEEALLALRALGVMSFGVVWISGTLK
jgi:hypothetical protein